MEISRKLDNQYYDYCSSLNCYTENETSTFDNRRNFRIMTYNVNGFKRYEDVINVISKSMSDVICLNEALFFDSFLYDRFLSDIHKLGYTHHEMCNKFGINVVISKYQIMNKKLISLGKDPIKNRNRYALCCNICGINICSLHLDPFDTSGETRCRQIQKVLSKLDLSFIILGDFNDVYNSELFNYTRKMGFRTSFEVLSTNSPPITHWSCRAIDHILIGPHFLGIFYKSTVFKSFASDHLPLYIDF